jgi:hypothetical protein
MLHAAIKICLQHFWQRHTEPRASAGLYAFYRPNWHMLGNGNGSANARVSLASPNCSAHEARLAILAM